MTPLAITTRDYPALAEEAARIYAVRAKHAQDLAQVSDPQAVVAADKARIMRALAAIWRAVEHRRDAPELRTSHAEIRAELADILAKLAADPGPDLERLERVKALAWHHRPWSAVMDLPHILMLHEANQELRRRLTCRCGNALNARSRLNRTAPTSSTAPASTMPTGTAERPRASGC